MNQYFNNEFFLLKNNSFEEERINTNFLLKGKNCIDSC